MANRQRQRARRMAARGVSAANIQQRTGVSSQAANRFASRFGGGGGGSTAAPMPTQRAPFPEAFRNNPTAAAQARYIPNLMVPGNESLGYRPEYGGGGWAAGPASNADLQSFYKAMAATGNKAIGAGSWNDIYNMAGQYGGGSSAPSGGGGAPDPARLGAGNRIRGNRNRNRGAKQLAKAPTQVQQAPIDPKFQRNLGGNQATYIPGLYAPGMPSYREEYGGGGWAGLGKGTSADQLKAKLRSDYAAGRMPGAIPGYTGGTIDRTSASSIPAMDQFYYGQPNPTTTSRYGTKATPGYQDIDGVTFSPEGLSAAKANNSPFVQGADYNQWAAGMPTTSPIDRGFGTATGSQGASPARTNVGAGGRISRGRIQSIMDRKGIKGRNADRARMRITNRLVQRGGTLGIGAAKDYAKAYAARNPQEAMMQSMAGQKMRVGSSGMTRTIGSPSNDMSSRKGQKGALYRGIQGILDSKDYAKGDVLASLRSGDVRAQPFGTGAGMGAGGGKGKGRKGRKGKNGGADMGADMGYDTGSIEPTFDYMPPEMDAGLPESDININMPTVADLIGNWATGYKTKRSSRRRAGRKAQGFSSQTVAPTGSWRYGT